MIITTAVDRRFLVGTVMTDLDLLNRTTDTLVEVQDEVLLSRYITPTNLTPIRDAFLAAYGRGDRVNPVFEYLPLPMDTDAGLARLAAALPSEEPWRNLFRAELTALRETRAVLRSRSATDMTRYSLEQYGTPDPAVLQSARDYLATTDAGRAPAPPDADHQPLTDRWPAERAARVLETVLDTVGLTNWSTEISSHMAARMSVLGTRRLVRVRHDVDFATAELRRLIVHEIGTHVFRSANSHLQSPRILAHGLAGYLSTEEGLAVWHEREFGVTSVEVLRRYALRYVACQSALMGDFCTVVDELVPYTTPAEAFEIAVRVKRGLVDTSVPGGFLKDQAYFGGAAEITAHLAAYPADYELLMASKWPITKAGLLRELDETDMLRPPMYRTTDALVSATAVLEGV